MTIAVQEAFPTISEAIQREASLPRHHGLFPRDGWRPQLHSGGRRITEWDRAQARLRQAEEIKRSLFCGVTDRDEELLELDREVDELELMMERVPRCWLPPLVPTNEALTGEKATTAITKHHIQAHSEIQPNPTPVHPFGLCVEDLFNHSYSKPAQVRWLWAPKS